MTQSLREEEKRTGKSQEEWQESKQPDYDTYDTYNNSIDGVFGVWTINTSTLHERIKDATGLSEGTQVCVGIWIHPKAVSAKELKEAGDTDGIHTFFKLCGGLEFIGSCTSTYIGTYVIVRGYDCISIAIFLSVETGSMYCRSITYFTPILITLYSN